MKDIIKLLRIEQWIKNTFVFLPLFFDKRLTDWDAFVSTLFAFISFSFIASSVYCINDILDRETDKTHPDKRFRPIASGKVTVKNAFTLSTILAFTSIIISILTQSNYNLMLLILFYLTVNLLYSLYLKHFAIIDVFIIALGFVLRVYAGGLSGNVILSHWIVLITFLLALFLGFAKRLDDVVLFNNTGNLVRKNIAYYNKTFLTSIMIITSTITMVSYIMYTLSETVMSRFGSENIYLTSFFVLLGIFRYLQLTLVENGSANPTKVLFKDRFVIISIIMWILSFIIIIYI